MVCVICDSPKWLFWFHVNRQLFFFSEKSSNFTVYCNLLPVPVLLWNVSEITSGLTVVIHTADFSSSLIEGVPALVAPSLDLFCFCRVPGSVRLRLNAYMSSQEQNLAFMNQFRVAVPLNNFWGTVWIEKAPPHSKPWVGTSAHRCLRCLQHRNFSSL